MFNHRPNVLDVWPNPLLPLHDTFSPYLFLWILTSWDIIESITCWLRSAWSSLASIVFDFGKLLSNRSERKLSGDSGSGEVWYRVRGINDCWTRDWTGWWVTNSSCEEAESGIVACSTSGRLTFLLLSLCCLFSFSLSQLLLWLLYGLTQNKGHFFYRWYRVHFNWKHHLRNFSHMETNARACTCSIRSTFEIWSYQVKFTVRKQTTQKSG